MVLSTKARNGNGANIRVRSGEYASFIYVRMNSFVRLLLRILTAVVFAGMGLVLICLAVLEFAFAVPNLSVSSSWSFFSSEPKFLVIGDWGREGEYNQSVVAEAMAQKASRFNPDFVISTGDNFYEWGLTSPSDEAFDVSFRNVYNQSELQVPWHAVLGNHDYGEVDDPGKGPKNCPKHEEECYYSPIHQLDPRLIDRDSRWHCERSFKLSLVDGNVDILFIDTTPILTKYEEKSWAVNKGGVLQQSWEEQVKELDGKLHRSTAKIKILVGHHPIRTNHQDDFQFDDMVDTIEPLIVKHKVALYMCGHDHNLQHIHVSELGYHQVISGAGSKIGTGFHGSKDSPFQYDKNGFAAVTIKRNKIHVEYIGVDNDEPLFEISIPV